MAAASSTKDFSMANEFESDLGSRVSETILSHIGHTPMVALNKIAKEEGLECLLLAKCEFFSAGGSVKDRIALRMIEEAEREGRLVPGRNTIIEPTSGNTGIGLALVAAIKGYRTIITLHQRMSLSKVSVLKALGAEVIRTPFGLPWDSPDSYIAVAKRLEKEIPGAVILNQFGNLNNPLAHELGTAREIIHQVETTRRGRVDVLVAGSSTGGTITGLARGLRQKWEDVYVVGVDPKGSVLAPNQVDINAPQYKVEGIGLPFISDVLDRGAVNTWIKTDDQETFNMSRRLIRIEGLLCGGSAGAAVVGAVKIAKQLKLRKDKTVVIILPDSIRDYIFKFVDDGWMKENGLSIEETGQEMQNEI